jgi:integrase
LLDTRSPTQIILITGVRRRQGSARETLRRENPGRDPDPPPHACHGCGYALANAGHDTRAIQDWLGHRSIQYTVRYTELSPTRFKDFCRN